MCLCMLVSMQAQGFCQTICKHDNQCATLRFALILMCWQARRCVWEAVSGRQHSQKLPHNKSDIWSRSRNKPRTMCILCAHGPVTNKATAGTLNLCIRLHIKHACYTKLTV